MKLDRDAYKDFKQLLLGLPVWADEEKRKVFIKDALWGHSVLDHILWKEDADTAATNLLETCAGSEVLTQHGKTPLSALLAEIRDREWASGESKQTVARLEQSLGGGSPKPAWPRDPYPGLLALDHWQAPIFFGRSIETRELLRRLTTEQGRRFLLVTGASGSGKSSLVRAGVWAALAKGEAPNLPASADWLITAMFPSEQGGDPFGALTNSLKQSPRLGWLYPGEEADKLKSDPKPLQTCSSVPSPACRREPNGCSSSTRWRSSSPQLVLPSASPFWTSCSRHPGCHASASSPPCAPTSWTRA